MMKLPARMQELRDALERQGWRTAVQEGADSADHPFLTLEAVDTETRKRVRATWHTRATGGKSLRLFSCMLFQEYRGWRDLSVASLLKQVDNPTETG